MSYYKLSVGAHPEGTSCFQGLIDEVRLYADAIEDASFARGLTPFCPLKLVSEPERDGDEIKLGQSEYKCRRNDR